MQHRWEYLFLDVVRSEGDQTQIQEQFNRLGRDGWEVSAVTAYQVDGENVIHYVFVRVVQDIPLGGFNV